MIDCVHAQRFLFLFHDNELDGPLRRAMQNHVVTCARCTQALASLERNQELLQLTIDEGVENIEFAGFWNGVERKLSDQPSPKQWQWRRQLWWETWRSLWSWPTPAWMATTAVLCIGLAGVAWQRQTPPPSPPVIAESEPLIQITDSNQAQIESLSTSDTVSVWNEPTNNSTVIWVNDEGEGE